MIGRGSGPGGQQASRRPAHVSADGRDCSEDKTERWSAPSLHADRQRSGLRSDRPGLGRAARRSYVRCANDPVAMCRQPRSHMLGSTGGGSPDGARDKEIVGHRVTQDIGGVHGPRVRARRPRVAVAYGHSLYRLAGTRAGHQPVQRPCEPSLTRSRQRDVPGTELRSSRHRHVRYGDRSPRRRCCSPGVTPTSGLRPDIGGLRDSTTPVAGVPRCPVAPKRVAASHTDGVTAGGDRKHHDRDGPDASASSRGSARERPRIGPPR